MGVAIAPVDRELVVVRLRPRAVDVLVVRAQLLEDPFACRAAADAGNRLRRALLLLGHEMLVCSSPNDTQVSRNRSSVLRAAMYSERPCGMVEVIEQAVTVDGPGSCGGSTRRDSSRLSSADLELRCSAGAIHEVAVRAWSPSPCSPIVVVVRVIADAGAHLEHGLAEHWNTRC